MLWLEVGGGGGSLEKWANEREGLRGKEVKEGGREGNGGNVGIGAEWVLERVRLRQRRKTSVCV